MSPPEPSLTDLASVLMAEGEATSMPAHGGREAAVLVPLIDRPGRSEILFTERRSHLRRHAGEISFPGGVRDPGDASLRDTALRESEEEILLPRHRVEVIGALAPVGTFVTSYRIQPFVGLVDPAARLEANPEEVERILTVGIDELAAGYGMRRLVRRGVPVRTPTFEVDEHLIWGATARILTDLLRRSGHFGRA